jgi:hypothetical protein
VKEKKYRRAFNHMRAPDVTQTHGETSASTFQHPERVNDFAPLFVMNLLRKAVVVSG